MIIARVNEYEISEFEFQKQLKHIMKKMSLDQPSIKARKTAIEKLIDGYLLLCRARDSEIEVMEQEIEEKLLEYMLEFEDKSDFYNMLSANNLDMDDLRTHISNEILIRKFITEKFKTGIDVPIDKIKEFYHDNQNVFIIPERVKASHVLIKGNNEESYRKAMDIYNEIESTEDFYQSARECSECPSGCNSGDLGYFSRGKMVKEFEKVVFNMEIDDISEPVKTQFGYHIIMVTDKKKKHLASFDDVKDALHKRLIQIESELNLLKYLKRLRMDAEITIYDEYIY